MIDERYDRYNEITFVKCAYVAISRALNHARNKKMIREKRFLSITDADEYVLHTYDKNIAAIDESRPPPEIIETLGTEIAIYDKALAEALHSLGPKLRIIIILDYFFEKRDCEIRYLGASNFTAH